MATTLNLNALPEYVNEHKDELFVKAAAGAKTLDYVELMLNVKHKDALNYLDSEVSLQNATCGWNPQGSDTFSQRYIEVKTVEVEKEWCYLEFKEKFMNHQLRFAAGRETLPFEEKIVESNVNAIKRALESLLWKGDESLGIDGFIKNIKEITGEPESLEAGTTVSAMIDRAVAKATSTMLAKGVYVFVSPTDFRTYIQEQNSGCCSNRPILDAASKDITYFGDSRVKIVPVDGLEGGLGDHRAVVASVDALVYGTDIEDSDSIYRIWFDEKEQKFMFRVLFNAGTAVKFPDEVFIEYVNNR